MLYRAVVPQQKIAHFPLVPIDELPLGRVFDQLVKQCLTFAVFHTRDAAGGAFVDGWTVTERCGFANCRLLSRRSNPVTLELR